MSTGTYEARRVRFVSQAGGQVVAFDNVPAEVCRQCGEQIFSAKTVQAMEERRAGGTTPTKMIDTPVYDLADVA
jgi:YgiT-type zinc finger domain-containing protein